MHKHLGPRFRRLARHALVCFGLGLGLALASVVSADQDTEDVPVRADGIPEAKHVIVLVVQDGPVSEERIRAFQRQRDRWLGMIGGLKEDERIAVLAFRGHLELVQDFTRDPDSLWEAVERSHLGKTSDSVPGDGTVLLRELLPDAQALEDTQDLYDGLHLLAAALEDTAEPVYLQLAGDRLPSLGYRYRHQQQSRELRAHEDLAAAGVYVVGMRSR